MSFAIASVLWPSARAQAQLNVTASVAEDKAMLVRARALANATPGSDCYAGNSCALDTWDEATDPCDGTNSGGSWASTFDGWVGVACDMPSSEGGRVVWVHLWGAGLAGELLPFFGKMGALLALGLRNNPDLIGDLSDLAELAQLRHLYLSECPRVVGDVAALSALPHLGEEWTTPGGDTQYAHPLPRQNSAPALTGLRTCLRVARSLGVLNLVGTGVWGDTTALQARPAFEDGFAFSSCSDCGCGAVRRPTHLCAVNFARTHYFGPSEAQQLTSR